VVLLGFDNSFFLWYNKRAKTKIQINNMSIFSPIQFNIENHSGGYLKVDFRLGAVEENGQIFVLSSVDDRYINYIHADGRSFCFDFVKMKSYRTKVEDWRRYDCVRYADTWNLQEFLEFDAEIQAKIVNNYYCNDFYTLTYKDFTLIKGDLIQLYMYKSGTALFQTN
jgi:hypothetical protein